MACFVTLQRMVPLASQGLLSGAGRMQFAATNSRCLSAFVQQPAPDFKGTAVLGGQFKNIKLQDYKGKYLVLFFYPLDL